MPRTQKMVLKFSCVGLARLVERSLIGRQTLKVQNQSTQEVYILRAHRKIQTFSHEVVQEVAIYSWVNLISASGRRKCGIFNFRRESE